MAENDPLGEIFNLFAAPVAGTIRSVEQFRTGVDEFLRGVENFNRTMENLNETTERINALLADVEEPIRAAIPQLTRSVKAADEMLKVVSGPAMAAAPAFSQIADALSNPAFQDLPARVAQFNEMMTEMSRRFGPLTQLAESAGGLFGLRIPGMPSPATPPARIPEPPPASKAATAKRAAKKIAAKKTTARKRSAKKTPAKKRPVKKTAARRSTRS